MTAPGALGRRRRRGGAFAVAQLFANGEAGGVYDPAQLTPEKVAWRRNLYLYSEPTSATGYTANNVTFTTDALFNFLPGGGACVELADATVSRNIRQNPTLPAGLRYTLSFYVTIAGGGLPNSGSGSYRDFSITRDNQDVTNYALITYENLGGGVYRAQHTWLHTGAGTAVQVGKYSGLNTNTAVRVTGLQLEVGSTATAYQRITDFTSDFLAAFPTHALYQNVAGTTPVTALGQPVALAIDTKTGGLANLGSDIVVNGDFASASGWLTPGNWSIGGGVATASGAGAGYIYRTLTAISGYRLFRVTFDVVSRTAGSVQAYVHNGTSAVFTPSASAPGSYSFLLPHTNVNELGFLATTFNGSVDNLSMREVPGVHAIQASDASRPLLDARVNRLERTEQFDDAYWTKTSGATITANSAVAPDGTTTADTLTAPTGGATRGVRRVGATLVVNATFVKSVYAKRSTSDWIYLVFYDVGAGVGAWFNVNTGQIGTVQSGVTASIEVAANGYYRCSVTRPVGASVAFNEIDVMLANADNTTTSSTGNAVFIWGADLRLAADAAYPYQRVTTATDYADVGVPRAFLFDGVDDSLYTASNMDLSGTDKVTVLAGVRKLSDAAAGLMVELSANGDTNNGAFYASVAPSGQPAYAVAVRGTSLGYYVPVTYTAPITNVVAALADIGASTLATEIVPRINGVLDQDGGVGGVGTGNFGSYVLFIGRRNNASNPLNGKVYQLIVRGALTDAATLAQAERYVGARTGIFF